MMRQIFNILVHAGLCYLLIGAVLWMVMDGAGIIFGVHALRIAGQVSRPRLVMVLATAWMIVGWPRFAKRLVRGRR